MSDSIQWKEEFISYGERFPNQTFYVIRRRTKHCGVFSYMLSSLTNFRYCEECGYEPVVCFKGNESTYLNEENIGKLNVWSFFFKQPRKYTPEDISEAKSVIINDGGHKYGNWPFDIFTDDSIPLWREYCHKYIKFSDAVLNKTQFLQKTLFDEKDKVVGVLCRGAGYSIDKPYNHPVQPTLEQMKEKIDTVLFKYHCSKIYLATEEEQIYTHFKRIYGKKLVSVADFSTLTNDKRNFPDSQEAKILKGVNYASSVNILSQVPCLIAGNTCGTIAARLLSSGYEYEHIFELGRY